MSSHIRTTSEGLRDKMYSCHHMRPRAIALVSSFREMTRLEGYVGRSAAAKSVSSALINALAALGAVERQLTSSIYVTMESSPEME